MPQLSNNKGFGLMEIVVAVAIASIALYGMSETARMSFRYINDATKKVQAAFLMEEGVEVVKIFRDTGWSTNIESLGTSTPYYLTFSAGTWQSSSVNTFVDDTFERKFQLDPVIRNASDDIAASGTIDPDTLKLTVTVSWRSGSATTSQSISTYITNLFQN
jgi:prepilin-type N-terminal cleavage/methylation domain-containing protein